MGFAKIGDGKCFKNFLPKFFKYEMTKQESSKGGKFKQLIEIIKNGTSNL